MSDLKALQRRFVDEYQTKGDERVLDELIADDFVDHSPSPGVTRRGRQAASSGTRFVSCGRTSQNVRLQPQPGGVSKTFARSPHPVHSIQNSVIRPYPSSKYCSIAPSGPNISVRLPREDATKTPDGHLRAIRMSPV